MKRKTVVITGGAGFIGSHLCDRFIQEGFRVICLDNFITGSKDNIMHLFDERDFRLVEHNVTKHIEIKERIDYILHFASPASPQDYLKYPIQTLKAGSLGTLNTLGLAKEKKARFMLASTSEVYGDPLEHPQRESYWGNVNPVGVRGCYDEAKRFAEAMTMAYHRVHKIDTKIARIFNTYGPRMRINDGRVVPNFIYQAIENKPLTAYGTGRQTRSFCYIDDLIEGLFRLMQADINEPVNLGNPREFSVLELARLVIKLTASGSKIVFKPAPEDDPKQRLPDITMAKRVLKWQPRINLEEGLIMTIPYFKNKIDIHLLANCPRKA
ncbi:MAG: SDR family oxidoreductase [Candidatus Omnitrophica bacterium]|nr:SDR family oxidoreductase [Candidatus Omnitrophota bacterium]